MPDPGLLSDCVLRHFPQQEDLVRELARGNADFCDMCDELGLAETALSRIGSIPAADRAERLLECEGWIGRLIDEMRDALAGAKVVALRRPAPRLHP